MYLTGFADEAAADIDGQIRAIQTLGWNNIECRNIDGVNLTMVSDPVFNTVCQKLADAGIVVNCFGSGIGNWAKKITDPPESSYEELRRAIPRMHRLGTKLIRIMSFAMPTPAPLDNEYIAREAITRLSTLTRIAEEGGVLLVHENCAGWAGQSYSHTLRMLDEIRSEALRLVFDTGNPVGDDDITGKPPYHKQDALNFYRQVRNHIAYIHIKDGRMVDDKLQYVFAGDGNGYVREICTDLLKTGYDGWFSIEPHMALVAHNAAVQSDEQIKFSNFVEYGRRFETLLSECRNNL